MMKLKDLNKKNIRTLVERLVSFDSLTNVRLGNVLCPFHDNRNTPSAKFYNDEDGIIRLNCFSEHRQYTSYDYLRLVMKVDPLKYLKSHYSDKELDDIVNLMETSNGFEFYQDEEKLDEIYNKWIDSLEDVPTFLDSIYKGYNLRDYK